MEALIAIGGFAFGALVGFLVTFAVLKTQERSNLNHNPKTDFVLTVNMEVPEKISNTGISLRDWEQAIKDAIRYR